MKKGNRRIIAMFVLTLLLIGTTTSANTAIPGSADDPLVTKSYLDEQIGQLKQELSGQTGGGTGGSSELVVEQLEAGQSLIGYAGTEIIVRTGHVVGISGSGGGIPDVTAGTDIQGTQVPHNHLLLIPRDDGRGIRVIEGPAHVMIRGGYEIRSGQE